MIEQIFRNSYMKYFFARTVSKLGQFTSFSSINFPSKWELLIISAKFLPLYCASIYKSSLVVLCTTYTVQQHDVDDTTTRTYILCTTYTVQQHDVDDTTRHTYFVRHTQCSNMTSMTQRQESLIRAKPGHRVHPALEKLKMRSQSGQANVVQKDVMSKKNSFKYLIDINNISNPL